MSMLDQNSRHARDVHLLWPLVLATLLAVAFFSFCFFVFSGRVQLTDPVVAGLVGSAITQMANIVGQIASKYFAPTSKDRPAAGALQQET